MMYKNWYGLTALIYAFDDCLSNMLETKNTFPKENV